MSVHRRRKAHTYTQSRPRAGASRGLRHRIETARLMHRRSFASEGTLPKATRRERSPHAPKMRKHRRADCRRQPEGSGPLGERALPRVRKHPREATLPSSPEGATTIQTGVGQCETPGSTSISIKSQRDGRSSAALSALTAVSARRPYQLGGGNLPPNYQLCN